MAMTRTEREALHGLSVNNWERERRQRVEALCAAITSQRAALSKIGSAHIEARAVGSTASGHMASALNAMHDALATNIAESNPFVKDESK